MSIVEFLRPEAVAPDLVGQSSEAVLGELCQPIAPRADVPRLVHALVEREKLGSTGIGQGVAIPHAKIRGLPRIVMSFGRSKAGVDFGAIDGKLAHFFFVVLTPEANVDVQMVGVQVSAVRAPPTRPAPHVLRGRVPRRLRPHHALVVLLHEQPLPDPLPVYRPEECQPRRGEHRTVGSELHQVITARVDPAHEPYLYCTRSRDTISSCRRSASAARSAAVGGLGGSMVDRWVRPSLCSVTSSFQKPTRT